MNAPESHATPAPDRILRREEVETLTGLSRSTLYRRIHAGTFPVPLDLGGGAVGWHESAVLQWIANRPPRAALVRATLAGCAAGAFLTSLLWFAVVVLAGGAP